MKSFSSFFLFLFIIGLFSCTGKKEGPAEISGKLINHQSQTIRIINYDGSYRKLIKVSSYGSFQDTLNIPRDTYYNFITNRVNLPVFLKKGGTLSIQIDFKNFPKSVSFKGSESLINTLNTQGIQLSKTKFGPGKTFYSMDPAAHIKLLKETKTELDEMVKNSQLNPKEKAIQLCINNNNYLLQLYKYPLYYERFNKTKPRLPQNYYAPLIHLNLNDTFSFHYSNAYKTLVRSVWKLEMEKALAADSTLSPIRFIKSYLTKIQSPEIKGMVASAFAANKLRMNNKNFVSDYEQLMPLIKDPKRKKYFQKLYKRYQNTKPGAPAPDFEYTNIQGGKTKLSDLKGKIKYIEVWATWCGPCKRQIPYLKKLMSEYKNKPIVFVGISIDKAKDMKKWKEMVKKENLGGVQLITGDVIASKFLRQLGVSLIPRSILIDENGKIIAASAPRPSSKTIRHVLDSLISRHFRH